MKVQDNLKSETKNALLKLVYKQRMTRNDIQRSIHKTEDYAIEIMKIRQMTKYQLT